MEIAIALGTAAGTIGGVAMLFRFLNSKIDAKRDKDACEEKHKIIDLEFSRGSEKIDKIEDILNLHSETLGRMDERIKFIAEKNGFHKGEI